MIGVVLCGGQSSRMGTDKGLLLYGSFTWAQLAAEKLAALEIPVVLSVNEQQYPFYKERLGEMVLIADDCNLNIGGPLKGILSVHLQYPKEDLIILACDMINMNIDVLKVLVSWYAKVEWEVYMFVRNDDVIETMCSVYTVAALEKILALYRQRQLKKHSLHYITRSLNSCFLPILQHWEVYFVNCNSKSDLDTL